VAKSKELVAKAKKLTSLRQPFNHALHAWYRAHARRLPWRESPSLYKTVVSEFMLQQTQVSTVLPYFDRWLVALPDFAALAAAPAERVLKLWEGLGYYSRARNLHRLAQATIARPAPPRTPAEWRELPGVGPYTAAAITSISFGEPAACVDGNVVRILARLTGERRLFRDGSAAAKFFAPLADTLIVGHDPGEHNQAMMELGATVCLRGNPRCEICPVAKFCAARRTGEPSEFPRLRPKRTELREVARIWCEHKGRLLLRRGHAQAIRLAGLHELPDLSDLGLNGLSQELSLREAPLRRGDEAIQVDRHARLRLARDDKAHGRNRPTLLATKRRTITRFRIIESIFCVKPTASLLKRIAMKPSLEWTPLADIDRISLSGPHKRWIRELAKL
jgi:A/G-specific adenine glycosylase